MIHVKVNKQSLTAVTDDPLVAKSVGIVTFEAEFSPEWDKYEKTIVFSGPGGTAPVLYLGGEMTVPWEALVQHGCLHVSAVGLADGMRGITAKGSPLWINRSGELGFEIPEGEPTPGPTEQAILACARYAREAKEAKDKTAEIAVEVEKNAGLAVGAAEESRGSAEAAGQFKEAAEEAAKEVAENLSTVEGLAEQVGKDAANSAANADSALDSQKKSEAAANRAEGAAGQAGGFATQADQSRAAAVEAEDNAKAALRDTEAARDGAMQSKQDAAGSAGAAKDAKDKAIAAGNEAKGHAQTAGSAANAAGEARDTAVDAANLTVQAKNEAEQAAGSSANSADEADNFRKQAENSSKEAVAASDEAKKAEQEAKDTVKDLLEKLAIKDTAEGNPIALDNSAELPLLDMKIYGNTTQDGTPTIDAPVEMVSDVVSEIKVRGANLFKAELTRSQSYGMTFENVDNSTIKINGLCSTNVWSELFEKYHFENDGDYAVQVFSNVSGLRIMYQYKLDESQEKATTKVFEDIANTKLVIRGCKKGGQISILLGIAKGTAYDGNISFFVKSVNMKVEYEPYKEQVVTLPEPITLNGVDDFKDSIECVDGVYGVVRRTKYLIFDGSEDEYWGIYSNSNYKYASIEVKPSHLQYDSNLHCNQAKGWPWNETYDVCFINEYISFVFSPVGNRDTVLTSKSAFKEYLSKNNLSLIYILKTPTFEPLPEETQSAIKALKSYYPNTFISTGAATKVEYVADTKHYIDKKLIELTALTLEG